MVEEDTEFITFDGDIITKEDIRTEIIDKYVQAGLEGLTKVTDFNVGSEAYHLADVMASYILEHREMIDDNYRMSMIHTAEGEFLDNFGDMVGVHRINSSGSTGTVTFTRLGTDTSAPITLSEDITIATEDSISFLIDFDGEITIEAGQTMIENIPVICEQEGAYTNVEANTITLVLGDEGSLVSVTNPSAMTGGTDIEEDDDYRLRILLSPYNVPMGTLDWYEHLVLEQLSETVHDVKCVKGTTALDADVLINFNPVDRNETVIRQDLNEYNEDNAYENTGTGEMTIARRDLIELFGMREYDIVGTIRAYHLADIYPVLSPTQTVNYYFAVLLKENYSLTVAMKKAIYDKVVDFNNNALISVEFNPSSLASIIENEVEGVSSCRIVQYDTSSSSYSEVVEPVTIPDNQLYEVSLSDLMSRIRIMKFNLDIELEE